MLKTMLLTVCLLVSAWQTVLAQSGNPQGPKSTAAAVRYSALGTAIPVAVGGALCLTTWGKDYHDGEVQFFIGLQVAGLGVVVGPGLGHAYAGRWEHLAKGTLFRATGALILTAGIINWAVSDMQLWGDSDEHENKDKGSYMPAIIIGGLIHLWSTIHDFRTLDDAVERYNQRHAGISVGIRPAYFADQDALGIVLNLDF